MRIIRTPEERFSNLADYSYKPNYVNVDDGEGGQLRIHYVDEGEGEVVLCLHGQPTWSYLYRKMIPVFVEAGYRVIAPDMVGFGKSDKPTSRDDYTYANHVSWINTFVGELDLTNMTLVGQDWGGLIGLRVLTENTDRFARAVAANTGLPDAKGIPDEMAAPMHEMYKTIPTLPPAEMGEKLRANENGMGFMYWIKFCDEYPDFVVSDVVGMSTLDGLLSEEQKQAYDAPFPSEEYMQGARQFPSLVPIYPDGPEIPNNRKAWEILAAFDKPFLTAFSDSDPVSAGGYKRFQEEVAGAQGQNHATIKGAGHFLQEDAGPEVAQVIVDFMIANPIK